MVDNGSMTAPAQVTIGTNHSQNTTDTPSKNNFNKEECGEIVDEEGDNDQNIFEDIVDNWSTASPTQVTIVSKHKNNTTDTPFNKNLDQEKGGEIVDDEVDYDKEKFR